MKILHVTSAVGWSGGLKQMHLLIAGLAKRGHQSVLVTPPRCELIGLIPAETRVVSMPMAQDYDLVAAVKLRRLIRAHEPDAVHAHHPLAHALALLSLTGTRRPPLVVTRRVSFSPRRNPFSRWKYRSRRIDRYSAVSESVKRTMVASGIDASRVEVVYSALDPDEFRVTPSETSMLRRELGLPEGRPVVGAIANLMPSKGQDVFLEAARICHARRNDVSFVLAGRGTETLRARTEEEGIASSVRLLGFRKDVPRILSLLSVSVNAALEGEGLSGALRESLWMGVPIVASDVSGNREIARPGETGSLFPPGNAEELAARLLEILADEAAARSLAREGRRWVLDHATADVMVERFLSLYSALGARREGRA